MNSKNLVTSGQVTACDLLDEAASALVSLKLAADHATQLARFGRDVMNSGYWSNEVQTAMRVHADLVREIDNAHTAAKTAGALLRGMA